MSIAYVFRLPYTLPAVRAVNTLLSISCGGDLDTRTKTRQRQGETVCVFVHMSVRESDRLKSIIKIKQQHDCLSQPNYTTLA